MALRLIIQDEEGATTIVPLGDEEITIGREAGNTIQLTEQNVSRQHARLTLGPDGWILEDLDSYNGIKVNAVSVEGQVTLNEGDLVQIGDYHLSLAENVEKTALNLDRPAVAANSHEVGDLPAAMIGEAAATGAMGGTPSIAPLTPPQPTYAESADEAAPSSRSGMMALIALLVIVVGVGGYFVLAGGSGPTKDKETPVAKTPETPETTPTPTPTPTPDVKPPDPPANDTTGPEAVEALDPDDGATATDGEAAPPDDPTPVIKKKTPTTTKKTPIDKPVAPQGDPKELLEKARKASVDGNSAQAYKLAKESYSIEKSAEALKMMGVSACKMGDAAKAQSIYSKVDAGTKKALTVICGQKGVELVDK